MKICKKIKCNISKCKNSINPTILLFSKCKYCDTIFCSHHRLPEIHKCSNINLCNNESFINNKNKNNIQIISSKINKI